VHTFVIVTTADSSRPGLTFKVEMPAWSVETWYKDAEVLAPDRHWRFAMPDAPANTAITQIASDGQVSCERFQLTWNQVLELLRNADYNYPEDTERRQGRPEKRVLVMTTSKERRTGQLVARGSY